LIGVNLTLQISGIIDPIREFFTFYLPYGLMSIITVFLVAWIVWKVLSFLVRRSLARSGVPQPLTSIAQAASGSIYWFLVAVAATYALGLQQLSLVLGLVLASLIVVGGLAVSGFLRDMLAGARLAGDRDFGVDFVVRVSELEGRVVSVGPTKTKISGQDGRLHIIPNSEIESRGWTVCERPQSNR
jgi:small-conductance mechanosensitive channel